LIMRLGMHRVGEAVSDDQHQRTLFSTCSSVRRSASRSAIVSEPAKGPLKNKVAI
jgi:hypothetical protein